MRYPLITPLASRDGTVEKDEKLVNCYGEQDDETKETFVFKRAGIDEGDAVISGPDFYGQGVFSYGGYTFAMIGDILAQWIYVGGMQPGGGGGAVTYYNENMDYQEYDEGTTYTAINDTVVYHGQLLYNYAENNTAPPNNVFGQYMWGVAPSQTTYKYATAAGGYFGGSPAAACNSYLYTVDTPGDPSYSYAGASWPTGGCVWYQIYDGDPPTQYGPFASAITRTP